MSQRRRSLRVQRSQQQHEHGQAQKRIDDRAERARREEANTARWLDMLTSGAGDGPLDEWVKPMLENLQSSKMTLSRSTDPFGITFMKAANWLLVARSGVKHVPEGSVLRAVNEHAALVGSADEALAAIQSAQWPLTLEFITCPRIEGEATLRVDATTSVGIAGSGESGRPGGGARGPRWSPYCVSLRKGRLRYYERAEDTAQSQTAGKAGSVVGARKRLPRGKKAGEFALVGATLAAVQLIIEPPERRARQSNEQKDESKAVGDGDGDGDPASWTWGGGATGPVPRMKRRLDAVVEIGIMLVNETTRQRLVLRAPSQDALVHWGGALYFAIMLANGGEQGHLLALAEHERLAELDRQEQAREAARLEQQRKLRDEEARAASSRLREAEAALKGSGRGRAQVAASVAPPQSSAVDGGSASKGAEMVVVQFGDGEADASAAHAAAAAAASAVREAEQAVIAHRKASAGAAQRWRSAIAHATDVARNARADYRAKRRASLEVFEHFERQVEAEVQGGGSGIGSGYDAAPQERLQFDSMAALASVSATSTPATRADTPPTVDIALPYGWEEHMDETQNAPYYYNTTTGETTWDHPGSSPALTPGPAPAPAPAPALAPAPVPASVAAPLAAQTPQVGVAAPPVPAQTASAPGSQSALPIYSLEELQSSELPPGVNPGTKEQHLSDDEFFSVFGKSKTDFSALPKWKRANFKKQHGLF